MDIRKIIVFAVLLQAVVLAPAYAKAPITEAEYIMMPPFCKERLRKTNPAENSRWQRTFGRENWVHMHHYCSNIRDELRASKVFDKRLRNRGLRGAREGYENHLKETTPNYILRYEIYYRIGKVSRMLDENAAAMQAYHKSMQIKPKYVGNYVGLSDVYRDMGKYQEALDAINQGLAHKPKSRSLLRRKKELEKQLQKVDSQPEVTQQN